MPLRAKQDCTNRRAYLENAAKGLAGLYKSTHLFGECRKGPIELQGAVGSLDHIQLHFGFKSFQRSKPLDTIDGEGSIDLPTLCSLVGPLSPFRGIDLSEADRSVRQLHVLDDLQSSLKFSKADPSVHQLRCLADSQSLGLVGLRQLILQCSSAHPFGWVGLSINLSKLCLSAGTHLDRVDSPDQFLLTLSAHLNGVLLGPCTPVSPFALHASVSFALEYRSRYPTVGANWGAENARVEVMCWWSAEVANRYNVIGRGAQCSRGVRSVIEWCTVSRGWCVL
ncbi:uncharacterized protein G2W53_039643 [Senna tora]|uniref:Uncharacterized protein n=1 Tax=Senna tora TaxID=362788 RepID=A0A834STP0_9FABA|nr:uncharacterized protein G2W53_039643 [Senna tora]